MIFKNDNALIPRVSIGLFCMLPPRFLHLSMNNLACKKFLGKCYSIKKTFIFCTLFIPHWAKRAYNIMEDIWRDISANTKSFKSIICSINWLDKAFVNDTSCKKRPCYLFPEFLPYESKRRIRCPVCADTCATFLMMVKASAGDIIFAPDIHHIIRFCPRFRVATACNLYCAVIQNRKYCTGKNLISMEITAMCYYLFHVFGVGCVHSDQQ